jgi:chemotaxis signal transduction protein
LHGDALPPERHEPATGFTRRFGVRILGLRMLLPGDVPVRVLVSARIYPVPRAMPRLRGLLNLEGLPLPVFDVGDGGEGAMPTLDERDVLVLREGTLAVGLTGCGVPEPVQVQPLAGGVAASHPDAKEDPLGIAGQAWRAEDGARIWYECSVDRMVDALAALRTEPYRAAAAA